MVEQSFPVPPLGNTPDTIRPDPVARMALDDPDTPDATIMAGARALREALRLAQRGYVLVPCTITRRDDGKKSAKFHVGWSRGGTSRADVLRDWSVTFPGCSFAILCGPSGVEIVDLDRDDGGPAWWAEHSMPVSDVIVDTPGGGQHHYFRRRPGAEPDDRLVNNAGQVAPGVDARTVGGVVFAPGSYVVGQEDRPYTARVDVPDPDRLAETPRAVLALWAGARTARPARATEPGQIDQDRRFTEDEARAYVALEARDPLLAAEYGRNVNDTLNQSALVLGHFVPEFWSADEAADALGGWLLAGPGRRNGWTALDRDDLGSIRSGLRRGMAEPYARRQAPGSSPLPVVDPTPGVHWGPPALLASTEIGNGALTSTNGAVTMAGQPALNDLATAGHAGGLDDLPSALDVALDRERLRRAVRRTVDAEERPPPTPPGSTGLAALLAEPPNTTKYRIAGLWPSGGKVLMSAPPKAGKTTMVGNLVRCLADTTAFLARPEGPYAAGEWKRTTDAGHNVASLDGRRVFLLDFEMTRDMLREWLRDQQIRNLDAVQVQLMRGQSFDPRDEAVRAGWAAHLAGLDVAVLIVDPIGPVLSALGVDENDSTGVGRVLWALDALCAAANVPDLFVVHHTGHEGERARGSAAFGAWPDAVWEMVRDRTLEGAGRRALRANGRDVYLPETVLELDKRTRRLSLGEGSRASARGSERAQIVADIVREEIDARGAGAPGVTTNELKRMARETDIGTKVQDAQDAIQAARRLGLVHVHEGANRSLLHYPGGSCGECTNEGSPSVVGQ